MIQVKATVKAAGRAKPTKNVFVVDALATSEQIAMPRLTFMVDLWNLRPW